MLTALPPVVRVYDRDGRFVRLIGAEGDGPGEFRAPTRIWATPGDTIVVFDWRARRLTYFASDGAVLRTVLQQPGGSDRIGDARPREIVARFADGSFLSQQVVLPPISRGTGSEIVTTPVRLHREVPAFDSVQFIAEIPFLDQTVQRNPGDPYPHWQSVPLGPITMVATMNEAVVVADPRHFGIGIFTMRGDTATGIDIDVEPRPVTDDLWDAELERRLNEFRDRIESNGNQFGLDVDFELAAIRRRFRAESRSSWLPHFGRGLHVQEGGLIWVESWAGDGATTSETWHVFRLEPPGYVGDVKLPPRFRPTAIYEDAILGVAMDDFDVQSIREYPIARGADLGRQR